jgi:energy-coupling factor transporter ATP-binding protein EcfA2
LLLLDGQQMPDYSVFGGCLRSELTFPELTHAHGRAPNWMLRLGTLSRLCDAEVLSDAELSPTCRIRLTRGDGWFRYSHSCTGSFEVFAEGRRILFEPAAHGDLNGARADFVSRVLPYCVDHASITWLDGSAVRIAGGAAAFVGPSGSGKSTIALALTRGGAEHLCDDTLPVEATDNPVICPGDDIIRICSDTRMRLASTASAIRCESDGKFVMTRHEIGAAESLFAAGAPDRAPCPLDAVYLLISAESGQGGAAVSRRLVPPTAAVPVLMQHLKLGPVMRREDPARLMKQLGAIVQSVPVYELSFSRDWSVVGEVVERLIAWHADTTVAKSQPIPA